MKTYKLISIDKEIIIANAVDLCDESIWYLVDNGINHVFAQVIEVIDYKDSDIKILRQLNNDEINSINQLNLLKKEIKDYCQDQVFKLNLEMKIQQVEIIENDNQLKIYFYADNRIDFRELAKKMAARYKKRIEFRQIGARDRAKLVGGIGPCGLILCCNKFLAEFDTISINMAKNQGLALNPNKINGQCSRLLCCLNYEDSNYTSIKSKLPNIGSNIKTKEGFGKVIDVNIVKGTYTVLLGNKEMMEIKCNND